MPRHREVSRIEGFSDAVFAFAITLLVVSLEVPRTFDELARAMLGFPAFAVCFALLYQVWRRQYQFFRSYDLEDSFVITLTGVLLFVILFYVYPLKFVWTAVLAPVLGIGEIGAMISTRQVPLVMAIYGAGASAVFGILALLYRHAYRLRHALDLSDADVLNARVEMYRNAAIAGIAALSIVVALALGLIAPKVAGMSGFVYFGITASEWMLGAYRARELRRIGPGQRASL